MAAKCVRRMLMDHGALTEMPACDLWRDRGVWAGGIVVGSLTRRVAVWCAGVTLCTVACLPCA